MNENIKNDNSETGAVQEEPEKALLNTASDMEPAENAYLAADLSAPADLAAPLTEVPETDLSVESAGDTAKKKKKRRTVSIILNVTLICTAAILLFLIIFMNLFILCPVSQTSMLPGIQNGQRVLLFKTKNIKRGEIFVFETDDIDAQTGKKINLIKRAVAISGDRLVFVAFEDAKSDAEVFLYLDKGDGFVLLKEDYLNKAEKYDYKPMVLGEMGGCKNKVYLAGDDALPESFDINQAAIDGLLDGCIINVDKDTYFALGDNRNDSKDSRSIGNVKKERVLGKCTLKLTSGSLLEKFLKLLYRDN